MLSAIVTRLPAATRAAAHRAILASTDPTPLLWRMIGGLFLLGGIVVTATLLAGVDPLVDRPAVAVVAVVGFVGGLGYIGLARRLPEWGIAVGLVAALGLVSVLVLVSHEADTPYLLLYVWVGVDAWFFLRPRAALALSVGTVVVSGAAMAAAANAGDGDVVSWWLALAATVLAVCAVIAVLRLRLEGLLSRLEVEVAHDPLTAVLNRRGFDERFAAEISRARRTGRPVALVLSDLDHFKVLNDRFGHPEGDEVLRRFAALCLSHVRGIDAVGRLGGEEFALILPDTDEAAAIVAADRLRLAVEATLTQADGSSTTASFGVACLEGDAATGPELFVRADRALYAAKRAGRNRTVAHGAPVVPA